MSSYTILRSPSLCTCPRAHPRHRDLVLPRDILEAREILVVIGNHLRARQRTGDDDAGVHLEGVEIAGDRGVENDFLLAAGGMHQVADAVLGAVRETDVRAVAAAAVCDNADDVARLDVLLDGLHLVLRDVSE